MAQSGTRGRVRQWPFFLVMRMEIRDANRVRRGRIRQVFVAFESDRDSEFGFHANWGDVWPRSCGPNDPQNAPATTYRHTVTEGYFGRHLQCQFDLCSFA